MAMKFDSKLISLGRRYADALFEIARASNSVGAVLDDLKTVMSAILSGDDMPNFLLHPVIKIEDKKDVIASVFKDKICEAVYNLLLLLVENNRFELFEPILMCFEKNTDEAANIERATVTSAIALDDELKNRLCEKLESKFNKKMILDFEVKPAIIAGLIIKIGDKVIDSSVSAKFDNMKKQLV